jgi:uncharacterized cupredoxin-like copper-binding protein
VSVSRRIVAALVALAAVVVVVQAAAAASDDRGSRPLGPGLVTVDVRIEHSRFQPSRVVVTEGTTVRFVVHNEDPIGHELIVGDDDVHARHERGNEAAHPPIPGEVSVPALETAETFYAFEAPGTVEFACHLPGHLAYGMRGDVVVRASAS